MIELEGLVRRYGEREALSDVSLSLPAGRTLVVFGPNGAGKTTLLRVLATLLRPHDGEVRVLGRGLPDEAWAVRGRVGLLGHEPLLYRELTARENLTLPRTPARRRRGPSRSAAGSRATRGSRRRAAEESLAGHGAARRRREGDVARPRATAAGRAVGEPRPGGAGAGRAADRTRSDPPGHARG